MTEKCCDIDKTKPEDSKVQVSKCNSSISWERLETAKESALTALQELQKKRKSSEIIDTRCQFGEGNTFFLTAVGLEGETANVSVSGVLGKIPYDFTLSADGSVFSPERNRKGKQKENIMWIKLRLSNPFELELDLPFSLQGVIRHPKDGYIIKFDDFQLVPELLSDRDDQFIWCLVGCLGLGALACAISCAWALTIPPIPVPYVTCIGVCMGANAAEIALCIAACQNIPTG